MAVAVLYCSKKDCLIQRILFAYNFIRRAGHVTRMGELTITYRILVGKPERRRLLGGIRYRLEYNIKKYLQVVG